MSPSKDEKKNVKIMSEKEPTPTEKFLGHPMPKATIIRKTTTDPKTNKMVREAFERTKADLHFAVRFGYVNGRLLGYDFRNRGEGWGYPKYMDTFNELKKLYPNIEMQWEFYYDGQKGNPIDNPNPVSDDF